MRLFAAAIIAAALLAPPQPALAQFTQFGSKLSGSGAIGAAQQGISVALSGDASTAIVGGFDDNSGLGAAWIFSHSGTSWGQQDGKLVGGNAVGAANEGFSVALSADGNTAILGGWADNNFIGAAWVFTRTGGWTQQGAKLVASGATASALSVALSGDGNTAIMSGGSDSSGAVAAWVFTRSNGVWTQQQRLAATGGGSGSSVALSADGNTAIVGGPNDNSQTGAAWVFTRSGGAWSQQAKLVGTGAGGSAQQGTSVALSADGNTAIVGGDADNSFIGAAWVFTRSGGQWAQQGGKLVGAGVIGQSFQGYSVALSADGSIAMVGGPGDNNFNGAAWAFRRSAGTWGALGAKLVGTGATNGAAQGRSVALSGDGSTGIVAGDGDNNNAGAIWIFVQPNAELNLTASHDFNGDGLSDIAWRRTNGSAAAWLMCCGHTIFQSGGFGVVPGNWQLVGQRDFDDDGKSDWLWRDGNSGTVAIWLMNGLSILQSGTVGTVASNWVIAGTSDFDFDGRGDILWRDTNIGMVAIWVMNGLAVGQSGTLGLVPLNWTIAATDRMGHIFWRDGTTGTVAVWQMYAFEIAQTANLGAVPGNWVIAGVGDFDGNGSTDILWRDTQTGTVAIWLMNGLQIAQTGTLGAVPLNWSIAETGDFNGFGISDIVWRDTTSGSVAIWLLNGLEVTQAATIGTVGTDWSIQGLNAD